MWYHLFQLLATVQASMTISIRFLQSYIIGEICSYKFTEFTNCLSTLRVYKPNISRIISSFHLSKYQQYHNIVHHSARWKTCTVIWYIITVHFHLLHSICYWITSVQNEHSPVAMAIWNLHGQPKITLNLPCGATSQFRIVNLTFKPNMKNSL